MSNDVPGVNEHPPIRNEFAAVEELHTDLFLVEQGASPHQVAQDYDEARAYNQERQREVSEATTLSRRAGVLRYLTSIIQEMRGR